MQREAGNDLMDLDASLLLLLRSIPLFFQRMDVSGARGCLVAVLEWFCCRHDAAKTALS